MSGTCFYKLRFSDVTSAEIDNANAIDTRKCHLSNKKKKINTEQPISRTKNFKGPKCYKGLWYKRSYAENDTRSKSNSDQISKLN